MSQRQKVRAIVKAEADYRKAEKAAEAERQRVLREIRAALGEGATQTGIAAALGVSRQALARRLGRTRR